MIQETLGRRDRILLTSDRWHVLRARWTGNRSGAPLYERTIVSEHADRDAAASAARAVAVSFRPEMEGRTRETRDQALVRRPGHKSLKIARRTGAQGGSSTAGEQGEPAPGRVLPSDPRFGAGLDRSPDPE